MQTLYGIKITDRVRVEEGFGQFVAFFDDERIGAFKTGKAAVNGTIAVLKERAKAREAEAAADRERQIMDQKSDDIAFLYNLSDRLGIDVDDLERLIEVIKRRLAE